MAVLAGQLYWRYLNIMITELKRQSLQKCCQFTYYDTDQLLVRGVLPIRRTPLQVVQISQQTGIARSYQTRRLKHIWKDSVYWRPICAILQSQLRHHRLKGTGPWSAATSGSCTQGYDAEGLLKPTLALQPCQSDATNRPVWQAVQYGTMKVHDVQLFARTVPLPFWLKQVFLTTRIKWFDRLIWIMAANYDWIFLPVQCVDYYAMDKGAP